MSASSGPSIQTDGLVFDYDMSNTQKSFKGPPATDRIVSTPLGLTVYAYATGPVSTANIIDATYQLRTVSRYTVSNNINTARAMVTSSGLTTGVSYTFSCKIRYNGTNVATPSFSVDASKGNPEGGANNNTVSSSVGATTSLGNGWYYVTYTWSYSACPTSGCYLTYGVVTGSDATYVGNTFDVYEPQFEVGSFATPYVTQTNGVRSNTQAILDLTNKNTITASSLTYASDNTFSFNGSNTGLSFSNVSLTNHSIEFVFKNGLGSDTYPTIFNQSGQTGATGFLWCYFNSGGTTLSWQYANGSVPVSFTIGQFASNTHVHCVISVNYLTSSVTVYINGSSIGTTTVTGILSVPATTMYIGNYQGAASGYRLNGSLPVFKIYNRALSATEIQQNFNAQRTRYGI
jgi:hypothetical protein